MTQAIRATNDAAVISQDEEDEICSHEQRVEFIDTHIAFGRDMSVLQLPNSQGVNVAIYSPGYYDINNKTDAALEPKPENTFVRKAFLDAAGAYAFRAGRVGDLHVSYWLPEQMPYAIRGNRGAASKHILKAAQNLGNIYTSSFGVEPGYILVLVGPRDLTNYWHFDDGIESGKENRVLIQPLSGAGMQILPHSSVALEYLELQNFQAMQDALAQGGTLARRGVLSEMFKKNSLVERRNIFAREWEALEAISEARELELVMSGGETDDELPPQKQKSRMSYSQKTHRHLVEVAEGSIVSMAQIGAKGAVHRGASEAGNPTAVWLCAAPPIKRNKLLSAFNHT